MNFNLYMFHKYSGIVNRIVELCKYLEDNN